MRVGDAIARVTTALGVKPCGGCKERQKALNTLFDGPLTCKYRHHKVASENGIPVYSCAMFGHCTLRDTVNPLPTCTTCQKRE